MKTITLKRFLGILKDSFSTSDKYCFILGAGASVSSGIKSGGTLAKQWAEEILKNDVDGDREWIEKTITEGNYAKHYAKLFERRYPLRRHGFEFLEKEMAKAEPGVGYSFLANILAIPKHNIVITTNFDSLTEDALFIYTDKKPLVIAHSSLAEFANIASERPLIIKIHHGVDYGPQSSTDDTKKMQESFKKLVGDVLKDHIPLVIGYGGNDGSLMNYLKSFPPLNEKMFWFYMKGETLSEEIQGVLTIHNGFAIEIDDFDSLLVQIGNAFSMVRFDPRIKEIAEERASRYEQQLKDIWKQIRGSEAGKALDEIFERSYKDWLSCALAAEEETDSNKKNAIYLEGIRSFPESEKLLVAYAGFLIKEMKDYDEAEKRLRHAIEINPKSEFALGIFAFFLGDIKKQYEEAEKYYLQAIEHNPKHANNLGNYAKLKIELDEVTAARELITKAEANNKEVENKALTLELCFYRYAVLFKEYPESGKKVEALLAEGVRSPGWKLDGVITTAKKHKHPNVNKLKTLAEQIAEEK